MIITADIFCVILALISLVSPNVRPVNLRKLLKQHKTNANKFISDDVSEEKRSQDISEWGVGGGKGCSVDNYPFVVNFRRVMLSDHLCAGSLITQRWVLSCAYRFEAIVDQPDLIRVSIGYSAFREGRIVAQERSIGKIILHPNFQLKVMRNDIALVYLARRITVQIDFFSKHFLKLPATPLPDDISRVCDPDSFMAVGWGNLGRPQGSKRNAQIGQISIQLTCANLKYMTNRNCLNYAKNETNDKILCTVNSIGEKGACDGDFGGPLFCHGIQYGIASWGYGCGAPDSPAYFTRVDRYLDFINSNIEGRSVAGNRKCNFHFCLLVTLICSAWINKIEVF